MNSRYHQLVQGLLVGAAICVPYSAAWAQQQERFQFDLPAQNLGVSLRAVTARAGLQLYAAADDINDRTAPILKGYFTAEQAIDILLSGSGLVARIDADSAVIKTSTGELVEDYEQEVPAIIVTGSRIKGSQPVVPATVITSEDIKMRGQSDLGEVARSLPQSFGGGQNPNVGNTQGIANENGNANGASTFNLRGIGPNATLTLLNGNRFGYTGVSSVIDVTAIPIAAVERVEIVADGSSAIYGADAVAGVVNIILKSNFSGVAGSARLGASSDGGNFQQQFGLLAGTSWSSGNVMAAYDFSSGTAINAEDRTYTSALNPETDLYPAVDRHNVLVRLRQDISPDISLSVDAIFKANLSRRETGNLRDRPVTFQGSAQRTAAETLGISPAIDIDLGRSWSARISGFYGTDRTDGFGRFYGNGVQTSTTFRQFDNQNQSVEVGVEGELIDLPAGPLRIAAGGGFRSIHFLAATSNLNFEKRRKNIFAYGEAYVPLIKRDEAAFLHSAAITGALRFEDYSDSDKIVVPKLGFTVEPLKNVRFGISWGKSFKLPTLYQQYSGYAAVLLGVSGYGTTFPPGSNFIYALGPDANVGAERSENWTANVTISPVEDMELSASYFNIDYQDRVAPPFASSAGTLTNPIYSQLVTLNPTTAQQSSIITGATGGLQNATAGAYDPARVVAILDGRDRNIARQSYSGVDLSFRYGLSIAEDRKLVLSGAATWLESNQQLLPGLPVTPLAGTIFRPPEFRARGGITFDARSFSIASFVNHSGGVTDNRRTTFVDHKGVTTVDLTGRFPLGDRAEIVFSALNLLNAKPDVIFTSSLFDTPFDTTNYSATGRFFSLTVNGKW